ncbi:MAG: FkbM family methyltransferase [Nitrososphaerales archaeon]
MGKLISWLLKEPKGVTASDQFILLFFKAIYIASRILLRIALGKKRRDRLFLEKELNFHSYMYKAIKFLRLHNFIVLKFSVPKYDYKVCVRINGEDFGIMTSHEDDIIEHFCPKEGDVFLDIGAHIGRYTIIGSKRIGENGKVVAVEPHPGNFEMLNRNIKLNGLTNVTTLNCAVYDKEMRVRLYLTDEFGSSGHHSLIVETREKFVEVNANTLDYLSQLLGIGEVNWIKIDVEGAEFEVLKGAHNVLTNSKDLTLLIEVHSPDLFKLIMELLRSYNCKLEFEKSYGDGQMHIIVRKSR